MNRIPINNNGQIEEILSDIPAKGTPAPKELMAFAEENQEQIMELVEADDNLGLCVRCGSQTQGVEPDARGRACDNCYEPAVYGAEELMLYLL